MKLDGLTFDQFRLEGLDRKPVQRRSPVEHYRVTAKDIFEDLPDDRVFPVDQFLGRFHRFNDTALDQFPDNERLEQFSSHPFRQTAFVQFERRADHDNRTTGVIHTLTEQVLTETALLAFQDIAQRFQGAAAFRFYSVGFAGVVEQRVDGFLQHPLFVPENDLRRFDLQQPLQAVVPDDHAAIQVVEVGAGEAAAIERHKRAQFRRHDR